MEHIEIGRGLIAYSLVLLPTQPWVIFHFSVPNYFSFIHAMKSEAASKSQCAKVHFLQRVTCLLHKLSSWFIVGLVKCCRRLDRREQTLLQLIERYILPGSHIVSDGWRAYANINRINNGTYEHSVITHQRNFVDPADGEVHTQNIENTRMRAKRKLKRQLGTSRALLPSYLHKFLLRNHFRHNDFFNHFVACLAENYA